MAPSVAQIDGAVANIALADVDAVVDQLQSVLGLPTKNRTLPVAKRVQEIGQSLSNPRFTASSVLLSCGIVSNSSAPTPPARELPGG